MGQGQSTGATAMVTAMNTAAFASEYHTEFTITGPEQPESPLFGRVCDSVAAWFGQLPHGGGPAKESGEFEELAYRRFRLEHPHSRNPDFPLRLDVRVSTGGGPVAVSVLSAFVGTDAIAPPELIAGPPRLVPELFKAFECYNGPDRLSALPVRLAPENAAEFTGRIFSPDRRLPILAISENWRRQTPVDPHRLQRILAGLAMVVTYGGDTADELRRHAGFQLACFNGAMRIYQPGCRLDDRREQHKFWMPPDAGSLLRRPAGRLVQEIVRHFPEFTGSRQFENVRRQVQQRRMAEQAAELLARPLRQKIGELEGEVDSLRRQLQERATGGTEIHSLHLQLVDKDSELDSLRTQLERAVHRETEYKPEIARLHRQQAERDAYIESLRQQLESAIGQAGADQSEVAQLHSRLLERDNRVEELRQELDKAAEKEAEAEQEMARLHARIQESDVQVESLRQQLDDAAGEVGASRQALDQLRASLRERDEELNALRAQLEDAMNRSEESDKLIADLSEGLTGRDADIAHLRLLLEGVEQGTEDYDRVTSELNRELQKREEETKAISALLEEARRRADAAENVAAELRRELELRPSELADIRNLIDESRGNVAEARASVSAANRTMAGLHRQIETRNNEIAELHQQVNEAQEATLSQEIANEDLEARLKAKDDEIRSLRHQLKFSHLHEPDDSEYPEEPQSFESVEDAVISAEQRFDKLRFLRSAFDSADGYPYRNPGEVYKALSLLQQVAAARIEGPLGMSIENWLEERGCDYAPRESQPTMQEFGERRRFRDGRQYVEMQEHIKIGRGTSNKQHYIRIHFCWEDEARQYLVGHVGEHLPTVSGG